MKKTLALAFFFVIVCKSAESVPLAPPVPLKAPAVRLEPSVPLTEQNKWIKLSNGESSGPYIRKENEVICGEENAPPMKGVKGEDFEVLGKTNYARDRRNVFFPLNEECVDIEGTMKPDYCYCEKYIVENANPDKFRYIGNDYAADDKNVYFRGELVPHANSKTVQLISGPKIFFGIKDDKNVYIYNVRFESADPATFQYSQELEKGKYLFKDAKNQWTWVPYKMPTLHNPSGPQ